LSQPVGPVRPNTSTVQSSARRPRGATAGAVRRRAAGRAGPGTRALTRDRRGSSGVARSARDRARRSISRRARGNGIARLRRRRRATDDGAARLCGPRARALASQRRGRAQVTRCANHGVGGAVSGATGAQRVASAGHRRSTAHDGAARAGRPRAVRLASDVSSSAGVARRARHRAGGFEDRSTRFNYVVGLRGITTWHATASAQEQ